LDVESSVASSECNSDRAEDRDSDNGVGTKMPYNYSKSSMIRDHLYLEKENAHKAAAKAVGYMEGKKHAGSQRINRKTPRHPDAVLVCDEVTKSLEANNSGIRELTDFVMSTIQQNSSAGMMRTTEQNNTIPISPSTKRIKIMNKVKGYLEMISK
jgi:hypothetical protein